MRNTFEYYRVTNSQLAAMKDQEDVYRRYLQRIDSIVSREKRVDHSP